MPGDDAGPQIWAKTTVRAMSRDVVTLLPSGLRDENGNSGDVEGSTLEGAKAIVFVLDVSAVSGVDPKLDVAIYAKLGDWYYRMLQFGQKTAADTSGRQIRRDGASFTDAISVLTEVPTPSAASGYVKDGVPWAETFVVAYKIQGTFAPGEPGPPEVLAEGITFSVTAIPLDF